MKNTTICALALGAALTGCYNSFETGEDGKKFVRIPKECHQVLSLSQLQSTLSLTCKTNEGKGIFYLRDHTDENWRRYELRRE